MRKADDTEIRAPAALAGNHSYFRSAESFAIANNTASYYGSLCYHDRFAIEPQRDGTVNRGRETARIHLDDNAKSGLVECDLEIALRVGDRKVSRPLMVP